MSNYSSTVLHYCNGSKLNDEILRFNVLYVRRELSGSKSLS
jgi:hypothetical protein